MISESRRELPGQKLIRSDTDYRSSVNFPIFKRSLKNTVNSVRIDNLLRKMDYNSIKNKNLRIQTCYVKVAFFDIWHLAFEKESLNDKIGSLINLRIISFKFLKMLWCFFISFEKIIRPIEVTSYHLRLFKVSFFLP